MVQKGVIVGAAAALVLGAAFVAAAVISRPDVPAPPADSADSKMKITLVAPKEPAAPATGPKLETVPTGAPDAPAADAAPRPLVRPDRREVEPEPEEDDFPDEGERAQADPYPREPYRSERERWRERRYEERPDWEDPDREGRRGDDRYEPFDPEPPPWWRR